jgi:hypothetical protein
MDISEYTTVYFIIENFGFSDPNYPNSFGLHSIYYVKNNNQTTKRKRNINQNDPIKIMMIEQYFQYIEKDLVRGDSNNNKFFFNELVKALCNRTGTGAGTIINLENVKDNWIVERHLGPCMNGYTIIYYKNPNIQISERERYNTRWNVYGSLNRQRQGFYGDILSRNLQLRVYSVQFIMKKKLSSRFFGNEEYYYIHQFNIDYAEDSDSGTSTRKTYSTNLPKIKVIKLHGYLQLAKFETFHTRVGVYRNSKVYEHHVDGPYGRYPLIEYFSNYADNNIMQILFRVLNEICINDRDSYYNLENTRRDILWKIEKKKEAPSNDYVSYNRVCTLTISKRDDTFLFDDFIQQWSNPIREATVLPTVLPTVVPVATELNLPVAIPDEFPSNIIEEGNITEVNAEYLPPVADVVGVGGTRRKRRNKNGTRRKRQNRRKTRKPRK